MVATPVSPAPAPQSTKAGAGTDSANTPEGEGSEGGFATLLQLLGLAEPPDVAAPVAAESLTQAVLQALEDDAALAQDPQAPVAVPFMQPLDIKAAQLLVRQGQGESGAALLGLNATAPNALATLSAEDIAQALQAVLKDAAGSGTETPDSPTLLLQPAPLSAQTQETSPRLLAGDGPVPRQLHAEVGTPAWSDELGARLQMMTEKGHHAATLRLSPENLGPLEVQISVQDDQATVWFGANHADTRAALEQALPRLRELFAAQGLSLSQSGVFQESSRDPGRAAPELRSGHALADGSESEVSIVQAARRGLVDAYA